MNVRLQRRSSRSYSERQAPPGWDALLLGALWIGIVLLGIQLWLLTVALDVLLAGEWGGGDLWVLGAFSGLVFVGGIVALRLVAQRWPVQPD